MKSRGGGGGANPGGGGGGANPGGGGGEREVSWPGTKLVAD